MLEESNSRDPVQPARRRVVRVPTRAILPIAVIAHEGEERDGLEAHLERARPVVTFPSLSHFVSDSARRERWAGIVIARTHAWDAQLDGYVPRRAFLALYRLADEGYGWPDAVKRLSTPEELDAWLALLDSPELPAEDKPRVVKPKRVNANSSRAGVRSPRFALAPTATVVADESKGALVPSGTSAREPGPAQVAAADGQGMAGPAHGSSPAIARSSERPRTGSASEGAHARTQRAPSSMPKASQMDASSGERRSGTGARGTRVRGESGLARGIPAAGRLAAQHIASRASAEARAGARHVSVAARTQGERELCALALEIGLARATELLALVRSRALAR